MKNDNYFYPIFHRRMVQALAVSKHFVVRKTLEIWVVLSNITVKVNWIHILKMNVIRLTVQTALSSHRSTKKKKDSQFLYQKCASRWNLNINDHLNMLALKRIFSARVMMFQKMVCQIVIAAVKINAHRRVYTICSHVQDHQLLFLIHIFITVIISEMFGFSLWFERKKIIIQLCSTSWSIFAWESYRFESKRGKTRFCLEILPGCC